MGTEINMGIAGAGSFAGFAAKAFLRVPGIRPVAIADTNMAAAEGLANELNATAYAEYEALLKNDRIDMVYIATPPFLHYIQSKMALLAGKHVICEKPAALRTSEAEELSQLAGTRGLLYVVNLMQRYNPLYAIVREIIRENIFGDFLHGFFENYASDENLDPGHWFWDESKSGGIFIEHGVHFFDLFEGWLGKGEVAGAIQLNRPGMKKRIIDRVEATVLYKGGIVNFYHGFDQPKILDRQEMRLQFECGEMTLYGWVPVKIKLYGLLKKGQLEKLQEMMAGPIIVHHHKPQAGNARGRFCELIFEDHITIEYENILGKQDLYREMLMAMIADQRDWIRDHDHCRIIDDHNAVESLRMAEDAAVMSAKNRPPSFTSFNQ